MKIAIAVLLVLGYLAYFNVRNHHTFTAYQLGWDRIAGAQVGTVMQLDTAPGNCMLIYNTGGFAPLGSHRVEYQDQWLAGCRSAVAAAKTQDMMYGPMSTLPTKMGTGY